MPFDQRGQNVGGKQYNVEGDQYLGNHYDHRHYVENVGGDKTVNNINNKAGHDIVNTYSNQVGGEQKIEDVARLLEALKQQLVIARQQGTLDADASNDAEDMVNKALQQTKKPEPDKKKLLICLNTAKGFLEGLATAGSVVASLIDIAEIVRRLL